MGWGTCDHRAGSLSALHTHVAAVHPTTPASPRPTSVDRPAGQEVTATLEEHEEAQHQQFSRLVGLFRHWAGYAPIADMMGCGLALFPDIPPSYARALAEAMKSWIPSHRDAAVGDGSVSDPTPAARGTVTAPPDESGPNPGPHLATPRPRYVPDVADISPPTTERGNGEMVMSPTSEGMDLLPLPGPYPNPVGLAEYEPMDTHAILSVSDHDYEEPWPNPPTPGTFDTNLCHDLGLLVQSL